MTPRQYSNIAVQTTLVAGIGIGALALTVADATGYPAAPFALTIDPGSATSEEVVLVTNKAGAVFTITRAYDGTTAKAHNGGALVRHTAIADDFRGMQLGTRDVATTAPNAGDALVWNNVGLTWQPGAVGTIDGSGAAGRLAIWLDANTLTSDAALTFSGTALSVIPAAGASEVRIGGAAGFPLLSFYQNATDQWEFYYAIGTNVLGIFETPAGVDRLRIVGSNGNIYLNENANAGDVGIGNSSPLGKLHVTRRDNAAFTVSQNVAVLERRSDGTPQAGFGASLIYRLDDSTNTIQYAGDMDVAWADPTHDNAKARFIFYVTDIITGVTTFRETMRFESSGSAAMAGFLGAPAAIRQTGGVAVAGGVYGATEQAMLQAAYNCLRTFGFLT